MSQIPSGEPEEEVQSAEDESLARRLQEQFDAEALAALPPLPRAVTPVRQPPAGYCCPEKATGASSSSATGATRPVPTLRNPNLQVVPPEPSSTGKRYYVLASHHGHGPVVCAGAGVTLQYIGGTWTSRGRAPQGFLDLEAAINRSAQIYSDSTGCKVVWQ